MNKIETISTETKEWLSIWFWLPLILACGVMIFQLYNQGRVWWCANDSYYLWSGEVFSRHNSQHLFDPYTFTHILHGILYCGIAALFFRKMKRTWRFFAAMLIACLWEVIENSNAVIERYRAVTVSLDYFGDSIANSLGDVLACAIGFVVAQKLGLWRSTALFLLTEIVLLLWIRDSLLLNILMLIYPLESIKTWQTGA